MANGTKVISETSLVTSIEQKKGSRTSTSSKSRTCLRPESSLWASAAKSPHCCMPRTTAIRQKSRQSTRRSK